MNEVDILIERLVSNGVINLEEFNEKVEKYSKENKAKGININQIKADNDTTNKIIEELTFISADQSETIRNQDRAIAELTMIIFSMY